MQSESGYYKIGVSNCPAKRVKQLQTGNAEKITLIKSFETEIPFLVEKSIKNFLSSHLKNGEWFSLSIEQELSFIEECERIEKNILTLKNNGNIFI
jgi:hypothetical protein